MNLEIIKSIYIKAKEKGGIWFLLKKIFSVERWVIMKRDIDDPVLEIQMEGPFQVRKAGIEDLHLFEDISKKVYVDVESCADRLRSGQTCYIALDQGRIIYFVWISSSDIQRTLTSHFIKLKHGEVCMYHALCLPEYKKKRIHSAIMSIRLKDLKEKSFKTAYVDCRTYNISQIKTLKRFGFVIVKKIYVLTIAGKSFYLPEE